MFGNPHRAGVMGCLLALLAGGCLESQVDTCSSGLVCPAGLVCHGELVRCVDPTKIRACSDKDPGDPCSFLGSGPRHRCAMGVCDEPWCGDGIPDPGEQEECQDGNSRDHDGCSRSCRRERFYWTSLDRCLTILDATEWEYAKTVYLGMQTVLMTGGGACGGLCQRALSIAETGSGKPYRVCTRDIGLPQSGLRPSARSGHSMAYDERLERVVLFGGRGEANEVLHDTWALDLSAPGWIQISTSGPKRSGHALAYHDGVERVLLFGGHGSAAGEVWQLDDREWTAIDVDHASEMARKERGFVAVYDQRRERLVVTGGTNADDAAADRSNPHRETWELALDPSPRWERQEGGGLPEGWWVSSAAAYDRASGKIVLFGGGRQPDTEAEDVEMNRGTWLYDPDTRRWTREGNDGEPEPQPRHGHTMVSLEEGVLLQGGSSPRGPVLDYIWFGRFGGTCNNSMLEEGEVCDGDAFVPELADRSCRGVLGRYRGGILTCKDCSISYEGCVSEDAVPPDFAGAWRLLPGGTFTRGSPLDEFCRGRYEDQDEVTLAHDLEIQATEVTQGQFEALMHYNPAQFGPNGGEADCGPDCPVDRVSWHEAAAYCNALSEEKQLPSCYVCVEGPYMECEEAPEYAAEEATEDSYSYEKAWGGGSGGEATEDSYSYEKVYECPGYRLPTEDEWEYAYRAGTTTAYYNADNDEDGCTTCSARDVNAHRIGWYCANSLGTTHPVGQKQMNAWGLYDMAGNVWEWCHGSVPWLDSDQRAMRGGSWKSEAEVLRAADRHWNGSGLRARDVGFRCVRTR